MINISYSQLILCSAHIGHSVHIRYYSRVECFILLGKKFGLLI